jgi:hypothetical protein
MGVGGSKEQANAVLGPGASTDGSSWNDIIRFVYCDEIVEEEMVLCGPKEGDSR